MTRGQWTVLTLLGIVAALELLFSPTAHAFYLRVGTATAKNGITGAKSALQPGDGSLLLFWLLGAGGMLLLAAWRPKPAITVAALLLVIVGLARWNPVLAWLTHVTQQLGAIGKTPAPAQPTAQRPAVTYKIT